MRMINDMARQLLREMGYQAEGSSTADDVVPREAAQNLGIAPGAPEYEAALNHLLALGDIEPNPDPALTEQGIYRLTRPYRVRFENYTGDSPGPTPMRALAEFGFLEGCYLDFL